MKLDNIKITRKNIKHMYLRILPPDGEIVVSAPQNISQNEIEEFIISKKDWIYKKQKYIKEHNITAPLKYKTGETHYLWGKSYTLQLITDKKTKTVLIDKNIMYLSCGKNSTIEKREKILNEFYRKQLKSVLPETLDKCIKIVKRKPNNVRIRKMKNWGNCKKNGEITLNLKLAKKDKICLEYVIIHELCHLIEFNHGKNFKKLMDEFCPNWKEIKKRLNEKEN